MQVIIEIAIILPQIHPITEISMNELGTTIKF